MSEQVQEAEMIVAEAQALHDEPFDPTRYLVNLNGRGLYLEVRNRLLWLRTEHPDAVIVTEMTAGGFEYGWAVFKATVTIPGRGSATGWKSEQKEDFRDFLEKAETGAIGRALAALGFGTQFCLDHEYGGPNIPERFQQGKHSVVDAPVSPPGYQGRARAQEPVPGNGRPDNQTQTRTIAAGGNYSVGQGRAAASAGASEKATERQVKFIYAIAREAGLDEEELATWSRELYEMPVDQLNRRDASTLIEALQRRRNETA